MRLFFRFLLYLSLNVAAFGALDAGIVWEVRTTGSQTNGGGFKTGASGTDYSQQDAAQWALTGLSTAGADATVTTAEAAATMVGNVVRVVSGTNATADWYEIIDATPGVEFELDRNWCSGAVAADGVINVGGAWKLGGSLDDDWSDTFDDTPGMFAWFKSGTYTIGEAISSTGSGTITAGLVWEGYNTTRGDTPKDDDRPLIQCGSSYRPQLTGNYRKMMNLRWTGSNTAGILQLTGLMCQTFNCKFVYTGTTSTSGCVAQGTYAEHIGSEFSAPQAIGISGQSYPTIYACHIHDCLKGIDTQTPNIIDSIIESCDVGLDCGGANRAYVINSTIRGCRVGLSLDAITNMSIIGSIFVDNYLGIYKATNDYENGIDFNVWWNNDTNADGFIIGPHAIETNPVLANAVTEGTDGATNAGGTVFTAASNPFSGVDTLDTLMLVEAGDGATLGVYPIISVDGVGQVTIDRSAGASKTGIDYKVIKGNDHTPDSSGSAAGAKPTPPDYAGAGGNKNKGDLGGTPAEVATSGGTAINKSGNKQ